MRRHSTDFYVEKYREIKQYVLDKGLEDPYRNLTDFINDYESMRGEGSKNVMKDLKYFAQYETSYKSARAMLAVSKELGGEYKLKDLKNMTTRQFAEIYREELDAAYDEAKSMFGKASDAALYIGRIWYGSE